MSNSGNRMIYIGKIKAVFLFFLLCTMNFFVGAQDQTGVNARDQTDAVTANRLATIKYGTETEIAALIQTLRNEGNDDLDNELIALIDNTRNQNILSGVFSFFGDREKPGLEDRALRAIAERDLESGETVLSAIDYLGKVKASQAQDVLEELLNSRDNRYMNAAFRALGRTGSTDSAKGDEAAEYLIDYYSNRDPGDNNRRDIIISIGETRSPKAVEFLASIAGANDERAPLRMAALDSLAKIGDP
ncbi:MAG: HEAT repeat domain-containing protein, partial [Treponema sp.]|nr:HEAT repeat domain-containing protein [Treponema sp.]